MDSDPREPAEGAKQPSPPDNSETRPAPGGAGTGDKNSPEKEPAAQPQKSSDAQPERESYERHHPER